MLRPQRMSRLLLCRRRRRRTTHRRRGKETQQGVACRAAIARALEVIDSQGTSYVDVDGDNVTSLVDGRECVFTYFENGICLCALEKAYNEGLIDFPKPISCHLYPVRLEEYDTFTAVNVHRWECCRGAEICGKERGIPVYRYLKNSLIRRFGAEWYAELSSAAEAYYAEFKSVENKFLSK